jgi:hypothetical protein
MRIRVLPALPATDVVVRSLPPAYRAEFEALGADLGRAAELFARPAR